MGFWEFGFPLLCIAVGFGIWIMLGYTEIREPQWDPEDLVFDWERDDA